jgi:hypothetical protein
MNEPQWGKFFGGAALGITLTTVAAVAVVYQLITPPHEYHGTVSQSKGRNL